MRNVGVTQSLRGEVSKKYGRTGGHNSKNFGVVKKYNLGKIEK